MEENKSNLDGSGYKYTTPQDSRTGSNRQISKFRTESAIEDNLSPLVPQETPDQIPSQEVFEDRFRCTSSIEREKQAHRSFLRNSVLM